MFKIDCSPLSTLHPLPTYILTSIHTYHLIVFIRSFHRSLNYLSPFVMLYLCSHPFSTFHSPLIYFCSTLPTPLTLSLSLPHPLSSSVSVSLPLSLCLSVSISLSMSLPLSLSLYLCLPVSLFPSPPYNAAMSLSSMRQPVVNWIY